MPDSSPSSEHDAQREFLRLFLSAEVDLYRYVCALIPAPSEARDVVQETALALWENFTSYDRARPFLPWALCFALNKARQHAARAGRFPQLMEDESLLASIVEEQAAQRPQFEARRARLVQCLAKLQPDHAALVRDYYWERAGVEALAARARSSVEALYKRLQRLRSILLECIQRLERAGIEPEVES